MNENFSLKFTFSLECMKRYKEWRTYY